MVHMGCKTICSVVIFLVFVNFFFALLSLYMCGLVHDVKTIFHHLSLLTASQNLF